MNREPRSVKLGVLGGVNQAWNQGLLIVVLLSVIAVVPRTQLELGNIESALRATAVLLLFFSSPRASCSTDEAERPSCSNEKPTAIDSPPSHSLRPCHSLDRAFRNASPLGTSMGPIADPTTTTSKLALEA
jgi:hypothetical protein